MREILLSCLIGMALAVTSCSSDDKTTFEEGTGQISLSMTAGADFGVISTRSVDLDQYKDKNNYTLQIFKSGSSTPLQEFTYANMPAMPLTLDNGSYVLKAFYGEEIESSRDGFRVEGSTTFNVQSNSQNVKATCSPTCAKVQTVFASEMSTYFSDYSVNYVTASGITAIWAQADVDPWYLKIATGGEKVTATINITRKADFGGVASTTVTKEYTLSPNKSWTLNVTPSYESGNLGIKITIDESTDDHEYPIEVPSDWV